MTQSLRNKHEDGFTLIEVMISLGLIIFFVVNATSLLADITNLTNQVKDKASDESDLTLAKISVERILRTAGPSFNLVKGNLDDNGYEYFDYYPDLPMVDVDPALASRTLTLSGVTNRLSMIFAVQSPRQLEVIHYNPMAAYEPVVPDTSMSNPAILTYSSLDRGGVISGRFPALWVADHFFLLKVPILLRYVGIDGTVNMMTPPRDPSFVGRVVGGDLVTNSFIQSVVYTTHPATNAAIGNVNDFLRGIPTAGGASPLVLLEEIEFVKLALVLNSSTQRYDLMSSKYSGTAGTFSEERLIAPGIQKVVFKRKSVSRPVVSVEIVKY